MRKAVRLENTSDATRETEVVKNRDNPEAELLKHRGPVFLPSLFGTPGTTLPTEPICTVGSLFPVKRR